MVTAGLLMGVGTYGRPRTTRRRPVTLEPAPVRCVCGTGRELSPCPTNCPTREENR